MATATKATKALRNLYLLIATPIATYAGYEGYKNSNSYLEKYPDPASKSWCFIAEQVRQPVYTTVVRSAWTVGSASVGLFFPITIPLYLHHVQSETVSEDPEKIKSELEE